MALEDYTRIVALGPTCTVSFQLKRGALHRHVPVACCSGPFDWMGATSPEPVLHVLRSRFQGYFDAEVSRVEHGPPRDCWTVVDASGLISRHHVRRYPGETTYSRPAWKAFRSWLDERVDHLQTALADRKQRLLFLRGEDPARPDRPEELFSLVEVIARSSAAEFRVVSVGFGESPSIELTPQLCRGFVQTSWPRKLPLTSVDWDRDYGHGPAWKGVDEAWNRLFAEV